MSHVDGGPALTWNVGVHGETVNYVERNYSEAAAATDTIRRIAQQDNNQSMAKAARGGAGRERLHGPGCLALRALQQRGSVLFLGYGMNIL
jgi:hypothetical protein